jgi:hypothetical protein
MLRHRWKILIGIAAAFVLLTCIELATIGNGPKDEVEAYKKSLISKGEKLEISELIPPPVPPDQNGADIVNEALGMFWPEDYEGSNSIPAMCLIAPGKAIVGFRQPDVRTSYSTNSWANDLAAVSGYRSMTELLRQAMIYPAIDFHFGYGVESEDTEYLHPTPLYAGADRLSVEAMCDLHQGNNDSATTNICAILALINGLQNERLLIFQEHRDHMIFTAANTTWELLHAENLSERELAILQASWDRVELIHAAENAISMQRAIDESEIMKMRTSDKFFNERTPVSTSAVDWSDGVRSGIHQIADNAKIIYSKSMYRASWTYSDELRMLQNYQIILEMIRTTETNRFFNPAYSNMIKQYQAQATDKPSDWIVKLDSFDIHRLFSMRTSPYLTTK